MVKICHLTSVHPPFDTRIFYKECRTMVQAGYEVMLIAPHDRDEAVDGVRIRAVPKPGSRRERMTKTVWQVYRVAVAEDARVYHFHDPELIPVGILLKLLKRAKVIYDVHEDYPQHLLSKEWLPSLLRRMASWLMWQMEKLGAKYLDAIVTPTDAITERFRKLGAKKPITLYNFPFLGWGSATSYEYAGTPQFDLIHTGTLSPSRLSFIFSIARELKLMGYNFKWCILGASPEMIKWAENEMNKDHLGVCENFTFVEKVSHAEVNNYLLCSKIGVNHHPAEPRFLVAIPVKVFEYMACGLPVISSDLPLLRKLLGGKNCAILVRPGDVQEFTNAVKYLLDNPAVAEEMGTKGRELIKEKYNWEKEGEKLLLLYQEVFKER